MRIILKKGKQKELIEKAKAGRTWINLSSILRLPANYIANELKNEERSLSQDAYSCLCELVGQNYDPYISERLGDNWGKSKGGMNSKGNTKTFDPLKKNKELAEIFGIILGDGHIEVYKEGRKRCYALKIAGSMSEDYEYLSKYVSGIINGLFGETGKIREIPAHDEIFLTIYGKNLIEMINALGIKSGNKKLNNQGIPDWIKNDPIFLKLCLRGLLDTDGSVHYISKKNKNLRISFTSHIPKLLNDVYDSFMKFDIKTSKIILGRQLFISGKESVDKYIREIGFKNQKHLKRLRILRQGIAPIV